uniref:RING-type domain-containing protein n=1 Tax=Panagrolaimus sp. PS1159 TaxID=55785 RepID=A0AC35FTP5_9BILA
MFNQQNDNAADTLLKALSNINYLPSTRQELSKPYHRREASPKINNDKSITSVLNEISLINISNASSDTTYSTLLNSFQLINDGLNGEPSSSSNVTSTVPITIDNLTNILIDIIKPVLPPPRKAFECLICYTKYYEDEGALACSPPPGGLENAKEEDAEKHLICVTCIRGYAHNSIFDGPVAYGGIGLRCVTDKCENVLLLSDFEHYLSDEDYVPLKTRLQDQCLLDAGLADLVTCPECAYKVIVEQSLTFYTCNCGRIQCRNCPRLYDAQHQNRTCQQMEELERQQASLPNINYNHFCNCNTNRRTHGPCGTCGKSCRNNEAVEELDQQAMNRLRNRA